MVSVDRPSLESVTGSETADEPTTAFAKATEAGCSPISGGVDVPVPVSRIGVLMLKPAWLLAVRTMALAVARPISTGVKTALKLKVAPAARLSGKAGRSWIV